MDTQRFLTNRSRFPFEELAKYAGQYVAWSPDGTQVLTSDNDPGRLIEAVKTLGYDPGETVISYYPPDDETLLAPQAGGATVA